MSLFNSARAGARYFSLPRLSRWQAKALSTSPSLRNVSDLDTIKTLASSPDFHTLPSELRNKAYEFTMVYRLPIDVSEFDEFCRNQSTPELFRANEAVQREASSVFYRRNLFSFYYCPPETVTSFLDRIGNDNAAQISRLLINMPSFSELENGGVEVYPEDRSILSAIQSRCTNLASLQISESSASLMEALLDDEYQQEGATKALKKINTYLRAIPSLKEIILEKYHDENLDNLLPIIKSYGWPVSTV